ncbi:MAG: prenyltransferase, partial [Pseudomonadota bacterium]
GLGLPWLLHSRWVRGYSRQFFFGRELSLLFIAVALLLLWLYSFAPVKLSYRGGGELLQMLGVGIVLPLFGYYSQSGDVESFPWPLLLFILPAQLACAMATALPDYPSDRASSKRTMAVLIGPGRVQFSIVILNALSITLFPFTVAGAGGGAGPAYYAALIPLVILAIMLFLIPRSEAGSSRLNLFVTLAVTSTVYLMAMSAFLLFYSVSIP